MAIPRVIMECFAREAVLYSLHARREMLTDEFGMVTDEKVGEAVESGELLEEYEEGMKCVFCHGDEIASAKVFEEIAAEPDLVRIPATVLVRRTCGERYYDRATMRRLERVRDEVAKGLVHTTAVSKVLQVE